MPRLSNNLDRSGLPHATEKTKDPWHAAAAFRKREDLKGSGISFHVYPDGTVAPKKFGFPAYRATAATTTEVGQENARWLDTEYVTAWKTKDETSATIDSNDGKEKSECSLTQGQGSSSINSSSSRKEKAVDC